MYHSSSVHLLKGILLPSFGNCESSCYEHPCAGFCVDVSFQFLWVDIKEHNCWVFFFFFFKNYYYYYF